VGEYNLKIRGINDYGLSRRVDYILTVTDEEPASSSSSEPASSSSSEPASPEQAWPLDDLGVDDRVED